MATQVLCSKWAAMYMIEWPALDANKHKSNDATMHAIATGWGHASDVSHVRDMSHTSACRHTNNQLVPHIVGDLGQLKYNGA